MSHRRTGTVPWAPWRPPYAIMSNATRTYDNRRPDASEAAPLAASWQWNLFPPTPSTFLRSGAHQAGRCKKIHVTAAAARSLLRSRNRRRRAPRLASCLSRAGPGSREFLAPTTRRWGGIWHLSRAVPVPPDQDLAADASRRRYNIGGVRRYRHEHEPLSLILSSPSALSFSAKSSFA
jgi:hypothetical protein